MREEIASSIRNNILKQGWKLAGFERDIFQKSYGFTDDVLSIIREEIEKSGLSDEELEKHWEWVDDGDGYNERQDWNIATLLEAQKQDILSKLQEGSE